MRLKLRTNWIRVGLAGLFIFFSSAISVTPASAQDTKPPDMQQLNNKLEQLEKELEEVKSQLRAAVAAQNPSNVQTAPPGKAPAEPGSAVAIPSESPVAATPAGTVPMEGEITAPKGSVDIYGFVMLDTGYDFGQVDPNWFDNRPTVACSRERIARVEMCTPACGESLWGEVIHAYQVRRPQYDI